MKVLFGSVIYKEAYMFLDDFLESLVNQTYSDFEILLINDNIPSEELHRKLTEKRYGKRTITCIDSQNQYTPCRLRVELLLEAKKQNCDLLILGDCDDKFSNNRVESIVKAYDENYDFYYNPLCLWNGEHAMLQLPSETTDIRDIGERNYLGLSNTALDMNCLEDGFLEELCKFNTNIFDWYFYSRLLLIGKKGLCVKEASTFYRMHENNVAGLPTDTYENRRKELQIKIRHYEMLEVYNSYYKELKEQYRKLNYKESISHIQDKHYWWDLLKVGGNENV